MTCSSSAGALGTASAAGALHLEVAHCRTFRLFQPAPANAPTVRLAFDPRACVQIKALAGSAMNPRHFGFIDPPPEDGMEAAMINLKQVGVRPP